MQHKLDQGGAGSCHLWFRGRSMPVDGAYPLSLRLAQASQHCIACCSESKKAICPKRLSRTCGSFDYEGESCSTLMCTSDLRNEVMQPDGKTVQKVNDQRGVDSAEDRFQPEGTTRETSAQTKQVPHHANESSTKSAMTTPRRGTWPSPKTQGVHGDVDDAAVSWCHDQGRTACHEYQDSLNANVTRKCRECDSAVTNDTKSASCRSEKPPVGLRP